MATNELNLGSLAVDAVFLGASEVLKAYLGDTLVWDMTGFVDEPKIDPAHALANRTTALYLVNGVTTGLTSVSGAAQVVDNAYASNVAGTLAMHSAALPAANQDNFRISALIKVDKTAGRYSRIGFASNDSTPATNTPDVWVGHQAGTGIMVGSVNFATSGTPTVIADAKLVDGAWYRVSMAYENGVLDQLTADTNPGKARVQGAAEPVDSANDPAVPWYPATANARHDSVGTGNYTPMAIVARTNSALGTIRDLYYIDSMLGATSNGGDPVDNAPITMVSKMGDGSNATDNAYIYSKGKAAPLRIIVTSGGSGVYGGMDFAHGSGRTGHPYDAFRKFWRDLADLGYTVLHTHAEHEGWGNDSHLAKQLEALDRVKAKWGSDSRLYYLGYSMGGSSMWRAIMGRNGFPAIRAAYGIAPISNIDMYWGHASFPQCDDKWPVRATIDDPYEFVAADLIARDTRVRLVTSTGDINVVKTVHHDPMAAKFATAPELYSELVHTGIGHFDPEYWDAQDCVDFFEGADA